MSGAKTHRGRSHPAGYLPPHCPNRDCPFYLPSPDWKFRRAGRYRRPSDGATFPSFRCRHCGRYFSSRTFSATYWLRYRLLFPHIAQLSVNGPGLRQIGRVLHINHATAGRHLARAGRHCLLLHRRLLQPLQIDEPLVIDGFESFEYSQFFPFHFNLAVGAHSWFIYHFTDSPLRRKGRMTDRQRKIRRELEAALGRPQPKAVENGILQLLQPLARQLPLVPAPLPELPQPLLDPQHAPDPVRTLVLRSDDHPAYRRALSRLGRAQPGLNIVHQVTSSKERRTAANPLFPVNLADLLLRHGGANHRRETIAFSKRRQGAAERLAVFVVWRNLIKRRREKEPGTTAAMEAKVATEPWTWKRAFRKRQFVRREDLPDAWWEYYWRLVKTPILGDGQTTHALKYAF